ncbi:hypothetical protein BGX38DRAFT_1209185 [Terfezia claveryi]|nr:hypothetical protein BGX38DRAFT_1209185 [Terfezia claveryi]
MALEVMAVSTMHLPFPSNGVHGQGVVDEFAELEKIVKLRDAVYADKHPRFKPPHSTNPAFSQKAHHSATSSPSIVVIENTRPFIPPGPRVPRPINTSGKTATVRTQGLADPQINDVLLAKSDVLIKAENNLKRDRIERELKQQLENKMLEDRLRPEEMNRESHHDDLDVASIIARAQSLVNDIAVHEPNTAPRYLSRKKKSFDDINSDAASVDQLQYEDNSPTNVDKETDTGEQSPVDHDMMEIDCTSPPPVPVTLGDGSEVEKGKVLNTWSGPASTRNIPANQRPRIPQEPGSQKAGADIDRSRHTPSPKTPATAPFGREDGAPASMHHTSVREVATPRSPMQAPRYSATRTEEPVAPQPVRAAADVTRLAAQDLVIDLRDDEVEERPLEPVHKESRHSPSIKPEPGTRPPSVLGRARRSASPATRVEGYSSRRSYYEYPELPRYPYPHTIPAGHVLPAYDPYYRGPYGYPPPPPPPPEYSTRTYGGVYPSARYPIYDDYGCSYHHHPPPHVIPPHPRPLPVIPHPPSPEPLRHSSRAPERRPASPEVHRRRRSLSPGRVLEGTPVIRPIVERAASRAQSLAPVSHRDHYERHVHPVHFPPGHYIEPYRGYYHPYPNSERNLYYDEGRYYAAPRPSPHYLAELPPPPLPREFRDGSMAPRVVASASYRERDYFYPPLSPMAPPPRPHAAVDYREYRELPRDGHDGRARSVRPEAIRVREEELLRSASVRPELSHRISVSSYAPPPPPAPPPVYLPPPPAVYRAMSARPERVEERAYMRGANELSVRERDVDVQPRERAIDREAEELRNYREIEEHRKYRDGEEQRRYSNHEVRGAWQGSRYIP